MFLIALLTATYLGNLSCKPCHSALYESYAASPMARTSGAVSQTPPGSYRKVRIDDRGQSQEAAMTRQLDYFIGSGAHGRSYLSVWNGFLFQAPFTWYSQQQRWDASPGFEKDHSMRWSRPIEPSCLWCHASQTKPIYATVNRYATPPFAQDGVACERCHGPGSAHVNSGEAMVNPSKLEPGRRDAVCAQCHLSGAARIEKAGKRLAMYRPGELLSDYVSYFVAEQGAMKATSHYEKLAASACKQVSGDKLWCGTCHSPHRQVSTRDACLSCHVQEKCDRGPDCATCHMPKRQVVDGGHGVLTDHSIPRRPEAVKASSQWVLLPWKGYQGSSRELGLAYAEVNAQSQNPRQRDEAISLLRSASPDADVLVNLAFLLQQKGEVSRAATLYEQGLKQQAHSLVALVNLGGIAANRGDFVRAEALWRKALTLNPAQPQAGHNLISLLQAQSRSREAKDLERTLLRFGVRD